MMDDTVGKRMRSSIVGVAVLFGCLAAAAGSVHLSVAAQPHPVTVVAVADPSDPVGLCRITRACWE